jgi:hypothetical protein
VLDWQLRVVDARFSHESRVKLRRIAYESDVFGHAPSSFGG